MELSIQNKDLFVSRHIGPDENQLQEMLKIVGAQSLASLNVPAAVRSLDVNQSAKPLGTAVTQATAPLTQRTLLTPAVATTAPAQSVTVSLPQSAAAVTRSGGAAKH